MYLIFFLCFFLKILCDFKLLNLKINLKYILYNLFELVGGFLILLGIYKYPNHLCLSYFDGSILFLTFLFFFMFIFNFKETKKVMHKNNLAKNLCVFLFILIISGLFETFVCNFKFFKTINYNEKIINTDSLIATDKNKQIFEIKNLNLEVKNIYIDVAKLKSYRLTIKATDEGNELYYILPTREISNRIESSKYINLNLSGKSEKLKLEFDNININLNKVIINKKIPLFFYSIRCLLIILILMFLYCFRNNSNIFNKKLCSSKYKKIILISLITFNILIFSFLGNKAFHVLQDKPFDEYNILTDSLQQGKVIIKDKNNTEKILAKMKNPYDTNKREKLFSKLDYRFLWDTAFYKGHYYVYFGVVPALLFYLPVKIIFNSYLSTSFLTLICTIVSTILITLLLYKIIKKEFSKCSIGVFILIDLLLVYCTGLEHLAKVPNLYTLPIASGLMFTFLGLNLFFSTLMSKKLIKTKFSLGALSLALVAGCRPQLLLGSFLIIPILISFYKNNKNDLAKKDYLKYILCITIPYLIVAILLMYYNYIRFDSPFDFGASYNLTTNDMTSRGFKFGRIPLGICMYLFNPLTFKNIFPFITETNLATNYMGITIYESVYGGLITTTLIYFVALFLPKFKKVINNKLIYASCWIMLISAFLIIIVDTQMAGILARYLSDFSWLFGFVTALIILAVENKSFKYKNYFYKILFILIFMALIFQFFYCFCSNFNTFKNNNTFFWLYFNYLIQFWL